MPLPWLLKWKKAWSKFTSCFGLVHTMCTAKKCTWHFFCSLSKSESILMNLIALSNLINYTCWLDDEDERGKKKKTRANATIRNDTLWQCWLLFIVIKCNLYFHCFCLSRSLASCVYRLPTSKKIRGENSSRMKRNVWWKFHSTSFFLSSCCNILIIINNVMR
jgi:hypothetical protein